MRKLICILLAVALLALPAMGENAETPTTTSIILHEDWEQVSRIPGSENLLVRKGGLWGMIAPNGRMLLDYQFDSLPEFIGGYAICSVADPSPREGFSGEEVYGSYYGMISDEGEIILEPEYYELKRSGDGVMVRYELGEIHRFLNLETGKKLPGSYDRAGDFVGDYAAVGMKGAQVDKNISAPEVIHWGTIDRNGKTGIHMGYDSLELCEDGVAIVKLGDRYGYMHADGREITRCRYDIARPFKNGFAAVAVIIGEGEPEKSELYTYAWGAIDETGREVVPCSYDELETREDGQIEVELGGSSLFFEVEDGEAVRLDENSITD